MLSEIILLFLLLLSLATSQSHAVDFKYNGFLTAETKMSLDGLAQITPNGLLRLTNSSWSDKGHAFYSLPIPFKDSSSGNAFSFSTTFVVAIVPAQDSYGHGMSFIISPSKDLIASLGGHYLGLFNLSDEGNSTNHIVAIEFDTIKTLKFKDIDDNHVGIDVNSLTSVKSASAAYFDNENGVFRNFSLASGSCQMSCTPNYANHARL